MRARVVRATKCNVYNNEKLLHIFEMYGFKKVYVNTMYNLNRIIVIVFKSIGLSLSFANIYIYIYLYIYIYISAKFRESPIRISN